MDNNTTLRSSLLYFVDEAIGYRHSIHFFHRWLVTGERSELEALIIEVGRENFVDLWPLLNYLNDNNHSEGIAALQAARERGLYAPKTWSKLPCKLSPLTINLFSADSDVEIAAGNGWSFRDWVNDNSGEVDPLSVLGMQVQLLVDSKSDFFKIFELLHMFFGNTLLSCVIDNDIQLLANILSTYYPTQEVHIMKLAKSLANNIDLNWEDALSRNQIKSKLWLIEKLVDQNLIPKSRSVTEPHTTTLVVGGWVGMLPFLASMNGKNLDSVINMDIDTSVHTAAHELNTGTHNNFKNSAADVREVDLTKYKKLIVIDTIVEHFKDHGEWVKTLPKGTAVVLQGNDMFNVPDHVNCHSSLEEFISGCGLTNILWSGELNLYKCTRYMAIGTI